MKLSVRGEVSSIWGAVELSHPDFKEISQIYENCSESLITVISCREWQTGAGLDRRATSHSLLGLTILSHFSIKNKRK